MEGCAVKPTHQHQYLPSTQRATRWAMQTLDLLKEPHPLWTPDVLFEALQNQPVLEILEQVEKSDVPDTRLQKRLNSLAKMLGGNEERTDAITKMLSFRHCCFESNDTRVVRSLDRWFYTRGFSSVRAVTALVENISFQSAVHFHEVLYFIDNQGHLWSVNAGVIVKVPTVSGISFRQVIANEDQFYALDNGGTLWEMASGKFHVYGQWPSAQRVLLTSNSPIICFADRIQHKNTTIFMSGTNLLASDGIVLLSYDGDLHAHQLSDGSRVRTFPTSEGSDQSMMQAAIADMASTEPGLKLLLSLRFWERKESATYRILQQLGDVLHVCPKSRHVISIDDKTVLSWGFQGPDIVLLNELEISNAWSVNSAHPLHHDFNAVLLLTTAGVHAIDFEHGIQSGIKIQPAFSVQIFKVDQAYRFILGTTVGLHLCRFERAW